jgi:hypothetical protein
MSDVRELKRAVPFIQALANLVVNLVNSTIMVDVEGGITLEQLYDGQNGLERTEELWNKMSDQILNPELSTMLE